MQSVKLSLLVASIATEFIFLPIYLFKKDNQNFNKIEIKSIAQVIIRILLEEYEITS